MSSGRLGRVLRWTRYEFWEAWEGPKRVNIYTRTRPQLKRSQRPLGASLRPLNTL
jgi:hypothetical protein